MEELRITEYVRKAEIALARLKEQEQSSCVRFSHPRHDRESIDQESLMYISDFQEAVR